MRYWVIPCNVKDYDVISAFEKLNEVDWKQSNNMKSAESGDTVLIYLSRPYSCIKYICKIKKVNKSKPTIDDSGYVKNGRNYNNYGNYMQLELIDSINESLLTRENLKLNGLKGNIQGPRSLKDNLLVYILEKLSSFSRDASENEPELENVVYKEGKIQVRYGVKFERNPQLRQKAIEIHGTTCKVCNFNFEKMYGDIGKEFIEIHHIKPMYSIRREISVNPETDLVPLCSNCHKMIHRKRDKPLTVEELKNKIKLFYLL
ncbi:HNH endonuclease [Staphylococcus chromogenes]|uniref:HNH endonuclease n=1 Tax=Staphylococcus chromogenes TaxID=46126 RepID=UPI002888E265|nr:HNH endonuclease [Staphylococcus chromogenes]MDT0672176.1 HNH endonuclease [Staphylococcus chromogenes]MDT0674250.1 HNH endonuclease [Staphylococcus chromogenes]